MPSLSRELRRQLERTIAGENGARQIAEAGAEQSLQRLAVADNEPHSSLTPDERKLRRQLRAHGRHLGDKRDPRTKTQATKQLKQAVAYEHWHRMLFARFLAENDLLLHPTHGVALSLDEVKELALELSRDWLEVAAEYAQAMLLRAVFHPDDPALRVALPPEAKLALEGKLNAISSDLFLADDSLGWVYQFWQDDAKETINRSEVKIGAGRLAAVTQLFTEDYIVLFLLENTLGAWWTARHGAPSLPNYDWTYLRLNEDGAPCAGKFDGWPKSAKELKVLDPCMGSGHFLTFALPILARMRAAEEGSSLPDAITAVLRDNLFGLELDPRCSQIAAFNLALTAWKLAGRHFELPPLHIACSGLEIDAEEEDWVELAGSDDRKRDLMRWLFPLFKNAPTLGSLIDPRRAAKPTDEAELVAVLPMLEHALGIEDSSEESLELAIAAQGLLASAKILSDEFTLVATNVPYLGRGKQDATLKEYCETYHGAAKTDLATCFVERSLRACAPGGTAALVTPQNWLFLTSYAKLRGMLLNNVQWDLVTRLGSNAFETISGEVVNVALLVLTKTLPSPDHTFAGWDVSGANAPEGKAAGLKELSREVSQSQQLYSPDMRVTLDKITCGELLQNYASAYWGQGTGDFIRFGRFFWEVPRVSSEYDLMQSTTESVGTPSGREWVVFWQQGCGELVQFALELKERLKNIHYRGREAWGKLGITVSLMGSLPVTPYDGHIFDGNCAAIIPHNVDHLPAIWCFCSSPSFNASVRQIDQSLKVTNATLVKVPFDLRYWAQVAEEEYPNGLPQSYSDDPTQWTFHGHPKPASHPLQVAIARLVGFGWPSEFDARLRISSTARAWIERSRSLEGWAASDGIVCLASVGGEENASTRLRTLLQVALGENYSLAELLAGKKSVTLEGWLRDEYFEEHCQIFHQRPFVWHVWDGLKEGFHALVNYHKLDRRNLEKLIYSYIGDWLTRQRQDAQNGVDGADTRLAAAEHLQSELKRILEGQKPYDVFVRWKPLGRQPVGWEPDLNDGVRLNIRPWITEAKVYQATKPGILRTMPNIKYTKDRGKEPARDPEEFPWFKDSTDRINDHHLSLEEKRRARGLT